MAVPMHAMPGAFNTLKHVFTSPPYLRVDAVTVKMAHKFHRWHADTDRKVRYAILAERSGILPGTQYKVGSTIEFVETSMSMYKLGNLTDLLAFPKESIASYIYCDVGFTTTLDEGAPEEFYDELIVRDFDELTHFVIPLSNGTILKLFSDEHFEVLPYEPTTFQDDDTSNFSEDYSSD